MSTNTNTTIADAIRHDLATDWHVAATARVDGYILHPAPNGVVAITVGSVGRTRPPVRPEMVTADTAANVRAGFLTDEGRAFARSTIVSDLVARGWNAVRMGDAIIVDGRS